MSAWFHRDLPGRVALGGVRNERSWRQRAVHTGLTGAGGRADEGATRLWVYHGCRSPKTGNSYNRLPQISTECQNHNGALGRLVKVLVCPPLPHTHTCTHAHITRAHAHTHSHLQSCSCYLFPPAFNSHPQVSSDTSLQGHGGLLASTGSSLFSTTGLGPSSLSGAASQPSLFGGGSGQPSTTGMTGLFGGGGGMVGGSLFARGGGLGGDGGKGGGLFGSLGGSTTHPDTGTGQFSIM